MRNKSKDRRKRKDFPRRISEREEFIGNYGNLHLVTATDMVNGRKIRLSFAKEGNGVTVIPLLSGGEVVMEYQYRAPLMNRRLKSKWNGYAYELPGGHMEKGEDATTAAKRELEEETGYIAKKIKVLYTRDTCSYLTNSKDNVCLATGLKKAKTRMDEDEEIKVVKMRLGRLHRMLKSGSLKDSLTRDALLHYFHFLGGGRKSRPK